MKALIDTDILSELMREKNATVMARADAYMQAHGALSVSTLSVFEVMQGLHRMNRLAQARSVAVWLGDCELIEFDADCAFLAGEIGGALIRTGRVIGLADTCIAATAVRHKRMLVTGNERHYEYVRTAGFALAFENWREPV